MWKFVHHARLRAVHRRVARQWLSIAIVLAARRLACRIARQMGDAKSKNRAALKIANAD
jgi:hypothetical protein